MSTAYETRREARPAGWWGMLILIATESALFGTLLGSYLFLRFRALEWPPPGIEPPHVTVPLVLAGVLIVSAVAMASAGIAARRGRLVATRIALAVALLLQCGYLAMQIHLFVSDLASFKPEGSAYASLYYTILGAHHAHVLAGVLLVAWLLVKLSRGFSRYRLVATRAIVLYWYFVAALGLLVVLAILSPRL